MYILFPISSLFENLNADINSSVQATSYIFAARTASYMIATIIGGIMMEKYPNSIHRYLALILVIGSITTASQPLTDQYAVQLSLWCGIGFCSGTLDLALPVLIYRSLVILWSICEMRIDTNHLYLPVRIRMHLMYRMV